LWIRDEGIGQKGIGDWGYWEKLVVSNLATKGTSTFIAIVEAPLICSTRRPSLPAIVSTELFSLTGKLDVFYHSGFFISGRIRLMKNTGHRLLRRISYLGRMPE